MVGTIERSRYRKFISGKLFATAMLLLIFCTPSAVAFLVGTSSHAAGLMLACGIILVLIAPVFRVSLRYDILGALLAFLAIHFFVARQLGPAAAGRFIGSCALLAVMFVTIQYTAKWLSSIPAAVLDTALRNVAVFFLVVAVMSAIGIQPPEAGLAGLDKPTFPFTEPSHFALAFTPIFLAACSRTGGRKRLIWLVLGLIAGAILQNLTVLVGVILVILITAPLWQLLGVVVVVIAAATQLDISYYLSRLDFSTHTQNLSTLVYLQGFDFITGAIRMTYGWGVGFQQLGVSPLHSSASMVIYALNGGIPLNIQDGGFVGAKAVSELGIFGGVAIVALSGLAIRSALVLRRASFGKLQISSHQRLCLSIVVGYMVDIYVRGVGYFSASSFMLGVAVFVLASLKTQPLSKTAIVPGGLAHA